MKLGTESAETPLDMGHVLEQGTSSIKKKTVDAARERRREKELLFQDKHSAGRPFGLPYLDPHCELKSAGIKDSIQSKSSENDKKSRVVHKTHQDEEEIVKYMSNLPAFLQQPQKQSSSQEKALNFGVLNWKHLEKWNYSERMPGKPPLPQGSRSTSHGLHVNPSREQKNVTYHKERKYVGGMKSKGSETCSQESEPAKSSAIHNQPDNVHRNIDLYGRSETNSKMKDSEKEVMPVKELERGANKLSLPSYDNQRKNNEWGLDDQVDITSDSSPADQHDIKLHSTDIPHSCPLPSGVTIDSESASWPVDLDIWTSPSLTKTSEGKFSTVHEKIRRPSFSAEVSYVTKDEVSEKHISKGRHPSSSRRFSFDLGRMSRSFSFKESSTAAQTSPFSSEVSSVMGNSERDKAKASIRGRPSPLRRLLDPLLKHKGAQNAETVRLPNGNLNTTGLPNGNLNTTSSNGPSQDKKPDASTFQALLQLSLNNGIPSFKLVVDNSNEMLTAVVRRLPASAKTYSCMIYTFYSVHENRRKSMSWITPGSRSKSCSLGYNVVGHMKISNSCYTESQCIARECVLYGVDDQDKQNPQLLANKEIAAIVVKNSSEKPNDGDFNDVEQGKNFEGTVVILSGGLHGVPIEGTHSSLISRWRSGGMCDCGGWDVGCKLRILTDYRKSSNILEESVSSSATDRIDLFVQGGKSEPIFSLEPFSNGFYSIELDASISLLEAFATCVAYITCRKFSAIIDSEVQSGEEHFPKYVSCPPLSPAGRI